MWPKTMMRRLVEWAGDFIDAQNRVSDGESDSEEIPVFGGQSIRVARTEDGSIEVSADEHGTLSRVFEPGPTRPLNYPNDLPFLPGLRTAVLEAPTQSLLWVKWTTSDIDVSLRFLLTELSADSWIETGRRGTLFGLLDQQIRLERQGRVRTLKASTMFTRTPGIVLTERTPPRQAAV